MRFKYPHLAAEYDVIHPRVKLATKDMEDYCFRHKLEEPMATHIQRTKKQQIEIYWKGIQKERKCSEAKAKELAGKKWTWHFVLCAIDLRDYIYTKKQVQDIVSFLKTKYCLVRENPADQRLDGYEILFHDVGAGTHFHIGYRDHQWAKTFNTQN